MLACNLLAAYPAVRLAHAGEEQPEIIVNLGSGGHRRAGVVAGASLLDCYSGGQAGNFRYCRFLHLFEKLPGIGAERLDVFPASFGVNRIEGERTLARAADSGDYHHLVARNAEIDILEIVLGCTRNPYDFFRSPGHPDLATPGNTAVKFDNYTNPQL